MRDSEGSIPFHEPVMVEEVLDALSGACEGIILDGTLGGGGHAEAMLSAWPHCHVVGVDRDPDAVRAARERLTHFAPRLRILETTFDRALDDEDVTARGLDGVLLDLGVSTHQLDDDSRGFAFRSGLPLDMRMDGERGGGGTAADFLNATPEEELARVFREYGEEPRARRLAREVARRRKSRPLRSSDDLVGALARTLGRVPRPRESARVFQAVRIALNRELSILEQALTKILGVLRPSGVVAVLAYHSLEDRIVKLAFREWSQDCVCPPGLPVCTCHHEAQGRPLFRKPLRPRDAEVRRNPRARSARLRAWRRAA